VAALSLIVSGGALAQTTRQAAAEQRLALIRTLAARQQRCGMPSHIFLKPGKPYSVQVTAAHARTCLPSLALLAFLPVAGAVGAAAAARGSIKRYLPHSGGNLVGRRRYH